MLRRSTKMRPLITLIAVLISTTFASAEFSEFVVLNPKADKEHSVYQPKLTTNPKNKEFVDIRIPYHKGDQTYWLITATEKLPIESLEFRSFIWGKPLPNNILMISSLSSSIEKKADSGKKKKFIEFTVHKKLLKRIYVYHDFPSLVLDGGYYYTYDLSQYTVSNTP